MTSKDHQTEYVYQHSVPLIYVCFQFSIKKKCFTVFYVQIMGRGVNWVGTYRNCMLDRGGEAVIPGCGLCAWCA